MKYNRYKIPVCTRKLKMKIKDKIQLTIIVKEAAWTLKIDNAKVTDSVENKTIVTI